MTDKTRRITLALIAAITALDVIAATVVRVITTKMPVVTGDVSKVGIGALAGAAIMSKVGDGKDGS